MQEVNLKLPDTSILEESPTGLTVNPTYANALKVLMEFQRKIEDLMSNIKNKIYEEIIVKDPTFKGLKYEDLKITCRSYGAKYVIDESLVNTLDGSFYTMETKYKVNTKEVDKYLKEKGVLPLGISTPARKKTVSITLGDSEDETIQA